MYYVHSKRHTKDENNKLGNVHIVPYFWHFHPAVFFGM